MGNTRRRPHGQKVPIFCVVRFCLQRQPLKILAINVHVLSSEHPPWLSPRSEMPSQRIGICPHPASRPKGQICCTQERMSCAAASAPLETSHAIVFLLLQRFGSLKYVCLTRLSFPSCAQISRHTLCVSHVDILRLNHFRS